MLTNIRRAPLASTNDPVDSLLSCHEKIRRFSTLGARLADADLGTPEEIREAARSVHRYFSVALPLHSADEDQTVGPRLAAWNATTASVREALASMMEQHETIHALLGQALPQWAVLAEGDVNRAAAARAVLDEIGVRLARLFHLHLALEEELIFPALRAMPATERAAIASEMKARHTAEDGAKSAE